MTRRYEALDGLRGVAAASVVALHLCEIYRPTAAGNPMHHAYLAVDFFFMLSGFVIGHAYDGRWGRMNLASFFTQRLRRLHPLAVLGVGLGLTTFLVERAWTGEATPAALLAVNLPLALMLLPAPSLPGHEGQTYSLDGPAWSLGQEYLANLAYALFARRLSRPALWVIVAVSGAATWAMGGTFGTLHLGWSWETVWLAPVRTAFPFFTGLLLQRSGASFKAPGGWIGLSVVLLAVFLAPVVPSRGGVALNGLAEAAVVTGLFPLVIAAGASSEPSGRAAGLCTLAGALSYPLYIVHYPLVRLYAAWTWTARPPHEVALAVGAILALALPFLAYAALKFYDEPVRAWLAQRRTKAPATALAPTASPG